MRLHYICRNAGMVSLVLDCEVRWKMNNTENHFHCLNSMNVYWHLLESVHDSMDTYWCLMEMVNDSMDAPLPS